MKNTPETLLAILMATVLGLTIVGCEKAEETAIEVTDSTQKAATEAADSAKEKSEQVADAAKEVGQSAVDTTTQTARKVEAKTAEELEPLKKQANKSKPFFRKPSETRCLLASKPQKSS